MTTTHIKPEIIFETSWEVCNKVGGIYTVLSTKYESMKNSSTESYIFIGPDVWKETRKNPVFTEDKTLFLAWKEKAEKDGLRVRVGRWNIPGNPIVILVDFTNCCKTISMAGGIHFQRELGSDTKFFSHFNELRFITFWHDNINHSY